MLIFSGAFLVIMAVDWLVHENLYSMYSFFFVVIFLVARCIYVPIRQLEENDSGLFPVLNLVINALFGLLYALLSRVITSDFGTYIFRITKTR